MAKQMGLDMKEFGKEAEKMWSKLNGGEIVGVVERVTFAAPLHSQLTIPLPLPFPRFE